MPLYRNNDTVRFNLPAEGEWVDVKRHLSRGDEVHLERAMMAGVQINAEKAKAAAEAREAGRPLATVADGVITGMDVGLAYEAGMFALLEVAIKGWSFPEPVTPAMIRLLDAASVEAVTERLDALYPPKRSREERANLSAPSAGTSEAADGCPASSDGSS